MWVVMTGNVWPTWRCSTSVIPLAVSILVPERMHPLTAGLTTCGRCSNDVLNNEPLSFHTRPWDCASQPIPSQARLPPQTIRRWKGQLGLSKSIVTGVRDASVGNRGCMSRSTMPITQTRFVLVMHPSCTCMFMALSEVYLTMTLSCHPR